MNVSVIVPVYNVSEYIERCLQSVLQQTYTDFECIMVDDCTPDDSIAKAHRLVDSYHGPITFRFLSHNRNRGLSAARNTGTEAAQGKYIYYLDSDDEITGNCLALLVKETEFHPEVELVQGGVTAIPYNKWYDLEYYQHPCYKESNKWVRYNFFKYGEVLPVNAWNKLVRKDFLTRNHLTFEEGLIHEDELWTLRMVKVLSRISIIGQPTYIHYATGNSIMSTTSKQRSAKNIMYTVRTAFHELDEPYKELQLYKYLWILLDRLEYGYNTSVGFLAAMASLQALLCCGHRKLALQCLKHYHSVYHHKGQSPYHLKENIANRWEKET